MDLPHNVNLFYKSLHYVVFNLHVSTYITALINRSISDTSCAIYYNIAFTKHTMFT